jgi:hypothetical protein
MPTVRLSGFQRRVVNLRSGGPLRLITITLADGEDLPVGDLLAEATRGEGSDEDIVTLFPDEVEGSGGVVAVEVVLDPDEFESYGTSDWTVVVYVEDDSSEPTRSILFDGLLLFRQVVPQVIVSTTITDLEASS